MKINIFWGNAVQLMRFNIKVTYRKCARLTAGFPFTSWFGRRGYLVKIPVRYIYCTFILLILVTTKLPFAKSFAQKLLKINYNLCNYFRTGTHFVIQVPMVCHLISMTKMYRASTTVLLYILRVKSTNKRSLHLIAE